MAAAAGLCFCKAFGELEDSHAGRISLPASMCLKLTALLLPACAAVTGRLTPGCSSLRTICARTAACWSWQA
jgi:hypothetical protein